MSQPPSPKTILITGANRGIGLETARQLARRGFHVIIGARDEAGGRQAAEQLARQGGKASSLRIDVGDSAGVRAAADTFGRQAAALDVLINNAGIYPDQGWNILTVPRDRVAQTFQTNTFGALGVTQAFLPYLRKAGAARVINVSSGYGQLDVMSPDVPSYCLSKLALNGVTILLAKALKDDRIAVNSVCPGWVRTEMGGKDAPRSVEEGAAGIVWLAADASHDLTGRFFRDGQEIPW